jgi:hypothetical protein
MKIACVTSIRSVGCTFVDWSLHFLSNRSHYYRAAEKSIIPLVSDPSKANNSHGHYKNHPAGADHTIQFVQRFQDQTDLNFCSMYPVPMHVDVAMRQLDIDQPKLSNSTQWKKVMQYIADDYQTLIDQCCTQGIGTVYIDPDPTLNLYFLSIRSLDRLMLSDRPADNESNLINEYHNTFFQNSIDHWQTQNLNNTWDIRDRMALDTRPFDRIEDRYSLKFSHPHLWINSAELWNHGTDTILNIMNFLDLPVHANKWKQWLPIYQRWHTMQQQHLKFAYQFNHIIDAIVNNFYYKLEKLSLSQEVAIQHALIYQHNLNLKTWQLEQFPSNTQDIHKLLESNIHPI